MNSAAYFYDKPCLTPLCITLTKTQSEINDSVKSYIINSTLDKKKWTQKHLMLNNIRFFIVIYDLLYVEARMYVSKTSGTVT